MMDNSYYGYHQPPQMKRPRTDNNYYYPPRPHYNRGPPPPPPPRANYAQKPQQQQQRRRPRNDRPCFTPKQPIKKISTEPPQKVEEPPKEDPFKFAPSDDMWNLDNLRRPCSEVIADLYMGEQCSSCSLRFKKEHDAEFKRKHMDWHFRTNRIQKESTKKAMSRSYYCSSKQWMEDDHNQDQTTEKESSFFGQPAEEDAVVPRVPANSVSSSSEDLFKKCAMCLERFHEEFDHDEEEWVLVNAVAEDGKAYHPLCHRDYKKRNTPKVVLSSAVQEAVMKMDFSHVQFDQANIKNILHNFF